MWHWLLSLCHKRLECWLWCCHFAQFAVTVGRNGCCNFSQLSIHRWSKLLHSVKRASWLSIEWGPFSTFLCLRHRLAMIMLAACTHSRYQRTVALRFPIPCQWTFSLCNPRGHWQHLHEVGGLWLPLPALIALLPWWRLLYIISDYSKSRLHCKTYFLPCVHTDLSLFYRFPSLGLASPTLIACSHDQQRYFLWVAPECPEIPCVLEQHILACQVNYLLWWGRVRASPTWATWCTKACQLLPVTMTEMIIKDILSCSRTHLLCTGCCWIDICPAPLWRFSICSSNTTSANPSITLRHFMGTLHALS